MGGSHHEALGPTVRLRGWDLLAYRMVATRLIRMRARDVM